MNCFLARLLAACLAVMTPGYATAADQEPVRPLVFGVMPYINTRALLSTYQPLAQALERELKVPLSLQTAPDFDTFIRRVRDGEYDLVLLAPHYARLAEKDYGYVPLRVHKAPIRVVLLTARDHPLMRVDDLRGQSIAIVERSALIAIVGAAWLGGAGLKEGQDYHFVDNVTHSSAIHSAISGKSRAAIVARATLILAPEEVQRDIVVFREIGQIPGLFYEAHNRLTNERRQAIRAALLRFEKSPEGQSFFAKTAHGGFRDSSREDAAFLDRVLPETRRQIDHLVP